MKRLLPLIAALGMAFSLGLAHAEDKPKTAQQTKMTTCNKDATGKKGDERKALMKTCLSAKADAPAAAADDGKTAQQTKMTTCNKDATGKKGDDRKAFMSDCLKK
ncbi:PsiF family protein [Rhodoferax sp.]|uniref:PsiF family protein n=1 Tax=Rhodoferax sp. TaxID=50421 RepID=UPI0025EDA5AF|nr:PsiF family protein [Rhodoferax sp.]